MSSNLTFKLKKFAEELGADLVGVANIERFAKAPIMMSPQGLLPCAKSVVVCAIHHPDGAIELGGEKHPQAIGPYEIQYYINSKLDSLAFKVANFLDAEGYTAMPIASSNIWRYRGFMDLDADFAPDMSHIYAATCAGLGQLGWHGLTVTPEYGAWNRFISIITDAPLEATPLYDDIKLCDMCGECIKHCPTDAYRKECHGTKCVEVEDKVFKFANKNLWRCAWAEHFDLDLDLEIPDVVNEQVLRETKLKHGSRGGEMGCCLRYCLPKHLRSDGGDFTHTYRRKKQSVASPELPVHRNIYDKIVSIAAGFGADKVAFLDKESLDETGFDYKSLFSKAEGAVCFTVGARFDRGASEPDELLANHGRGDGGHIYSSYKQASNTLARFADLDISRFLENEGFESVCDYEASGSRAIAAYAGVVAEDGVIAVTCVVLTNAKLKKQHYFGLTEPDFNRRLTLEQNLERQLQELGSESFGFTSAAEMDAMAEKLAAVKDGETLFVAKDKNPIHTPYAPVTSSVKRKIHKCGDYLTGAKSVIVFAQHYPDAAAKMALKPPAFAVGPYVFANYQANFECNFAGLKLLNYLHGLGYKAIMTPDLTGIGGDVGSPRGFLNDALCNSFEAVEAGLGALAKNGVCYTKQHGFNQRFMAIITDAPLEKLSTGGVPFDVVEGNCKGCDNCSKSCPAQALADKKAIDITLGGRTYKWIPADSARCEWSKKHALCGEDGCKYTGSTTNVPLPESINEENLADALRQSDPTLKYRPTTAERCIIDCPLATR